ncbi:sigma-70 family RNA polymerase sigma factor [Glaciihabitans sp. GrIS 2.15]|uniref:sigma-70 family RNA polymerase sigma factor n=1 Tax=Glaciihabitans sp. GrIS 2.15 TaxID=3071710 RepID=UPI002DFE64A3|nr:RNA polymerase sigma factor (sigma-70 family) [Glaciihabitans sp. GrIS 2.15]
MAAAAPQEQTAYGGWQSVVATLVAERGDSLTRYAWLISGSADDAADLVQDALVKTFGRLRNGFTVSSAEAYVRRAILNTWLDKGRRTTRWRRIAHLTAVTDIQDSSAPATDSRLDLSAELAKLTPRERACIVLRYYEDLKVDDIAEWLGISSGAVKRYLSDGLATMAVALAEDPSSARPGPTTTTTTTDTQGAIHVHRI